MGFGKAAKEVAILHVGVASHCFKNSEIRGPNEGIGDQDAHEEVQEESEHLSARRLLFGTGPVSFILHVGTHVAPWEQTICNDVRNKHIHDTNHEPSQHDQDESTEIMLDKVPSLTQIFATVKLGLSQGNPLF